VIRGDALARQGRFAKAAEDYEMALEVAVDPDVESEARRGLDAIAGNL
jgi:hypothetical protein